MINDVTANTRYYNVERLHTANGELSPVEYEQSSLRKVSYAIKPDQIYPYFHDCSKRL